MLKNIKYLIGFFFLATILTRSQSFDIHDERIVLKDYNYNLSQNTINPNYYNFAQTVKIEHNTNELLDPIIQLNSSEQLKVYFDILTNESNDYAYTFIHCDANWNYSNMNQSDYLVGFYDNYIINYTYSFNTLTNYCHYEFNFPNENVNFTKSGNYIVLIYDNSNNKPVATKRFMIDENLMDIEIDIKKATLATDRDTKQEIDFYITTNNTPISNVASELKIIVQKNDDWNNIITNCQPSFIGNSTLEFDHQGDISFLGGNEYRDFDIKSLRYYGKNIENIEKEIIQEESIYFVEITKDWIYNKEEYQFKYDLNGKFVSAVSENKNRKNESEYALVKFRLKSHEMQGDVFIYGELTNWDLLQNAKMNYNDKSKEYYGFLYLKQGYYNYQYVTKDHNNQIVFLDGNYQETRNQYSVYIYYCPIWGDYDRLISVGKSTSNSLN